MEKQDEEAVFNFNALFYAGVLTAAVVGFGFGRLAIKHTLGRYRPESFAFMDKSYGVVVYGVPAALFSSLTYFKLNDFFIHEYAERLTDKYIDEAKANGFMDYTVSIDK